jgi:hypothetical protein
MAKHDRREGDEQKRGRKRRGVMMIKINKWMRREEKKEPGVRWLVCHWFTCGFL